MRLCQHPSIEMYTNQNFWILRICRNRLMFLQGDKATIFRSVTKIAPNTHVGVNMIYLKIESFLLLRTFSMLNYLISYFLTFITGVSRPTPGGSPGPHSGVSQHALRQTPPADGYCCRRYASFWNAFLLCRLHHNLFLATQIQ